VNQKTRNKKSIVLLSLLGATLVTGAFFYRRNVLAHLPKPQPIEKDPKVQAMVNELTKLHKAVEEAPGDTNRRWALAAFYRDNNMMKRAVEQIEVIANLNPDRSSTLLSLAVAKMSVGDLRGSEETYKSITERWPNLMDGWQGLSAAYYHEGRFPEALSAAKKATKISPDDPNNLLLEAKAALEHAIDINDPELVFADLELARVDFERLIKAWPDKGELYNDLGHTFLVEREYDKAVNTLKKAMEVAPTNASVYVNLCKTYLRIGRKPDAQKVAEQGIARKLDDPRLYDVYGQAVQVSGEPDADMKAVDAFKKAVKLAPSSPIYLERLGAAYLRTNNLEGARDCFTRSAQANPNRAFPYQQLALVFNRMGVADRAKTASEMATKMYQNENQLNQITALSKLHPEDISLHFILADRHKDLKEYGPSGHEYIAILKLDPNNARAKDGLAKVTQLSQAEQAH
jgi:tetratricopeptide (TPR) repeat protein